MAWNQNDTNPRNRRKHARAGQRGGFTLCENACWRHCQRACPDALPTYLGLCSFCGKTNAQRPRECWPSLDTIADAACISRSSVKRHLPLLVAAGLVTVRKNALVTMPDGRQVKHTVYYVQRNPLPVDDTALASVKKANRRTDTAKQDLTSGRTVPRKKFTSGPVPRSTGEPSLRSTGEPGDGFASESMDQVVGDLGRGSPVVPETTPQNGPQEIDQLDQNSAADMVPQTVSLPAALTAEPLSQYGPERIQYSTPYDVDFERFWSSYPRKQRKPAAWDAWQEAGMRPPLQQLLSAVERSVRSPEWQRDGGQFIPQPARWLSERRWEDEVQVSGKSLRETVASAATANPFFAKAFLKEMKHD